MLRKGVVVIKQLAFEFCKSLMTSFKMKKKASILILPMGERTDLLCLSGTNQLIASIEKGRLHITKVNQYLVGPLLEKGLHPWLKWLEKEFDLTLIGGGPDQMVIVRGLQLELVQKFAIDRVLPFKLEQHLPMPLEEMHIGYVIQERGSSGSWATVHVCSRTQLDNFLSSCRKTLGEELDLFYPQSLLLFQALHEKRKNETFVFLHQIDAYYIAFLSHQGRLLASKTMKNNIQTLVKHFEKLAQELEKDSLTLLLFKGWDTNIFSSFWCIEELDQSIQDYFLLGLSSIQNPFISSLSVNLLSKVNPERLNRIDKNWMRTIFLMCFCFSCTILSFFYLFTSKQRIESMNLYHCLREKMEFHSIEELKKTPSSLQEAYKDVSSLIRKEEENDFEADFFSYPSLERIIAWICLETYPYQDLKEKPFVRITKISYSVHDRSRPFFSFSFSGKSEKDLDLFIKQVMSRTSQKYFSDLIWNTNQLEGTCECLLINQMDDSL